MTSGELILGIVRDAKLRKDYEAALAASEPEHSEECAYCGKDARTCEHFTPDEPDNDTPYSSRDEGRNQDGTGESYAERNI